jgi:chorismate-pyruvate lyase
MHEASTAVRAEAFDPLSVFYAWNHRPIPRFDLLEPDAVPQPYRELLVHNRDMTPRLEAFHGARVHIEPIHVLYENQAYTREVILRLDGSAWPVEYGAVRIHLSRLPEEVSEEVRVARRPLGTILGEAGLPRVSRPVRYLRVHPDETIRGTLHIGKADVVYARQNRILNADGDPLAEVLEIVPP